MSPARRLSDTEALTRQPVLETSNPDYSGFRNSSQKQYGLLDVSDDCSPSRKGPVHSLRSGVALLRRGG